VERLGRFLADLAAADPDDLYEREPTKAAAFRRSLDTRASEEPQDTSAGA
jgi:hypothetical protein